ncbi:MAG TPA: hypothetical protein DCE41_33440 [Cytophagales bacterium]|nr:hypothetical protein [Cytophagales bacterium]HAA19396.1 hypothetical protein [Cytophagales bacterium]HAP61269.1 hypothetical protein [Cytophagales bacterium]
MTVVEIKARLHSLIEQEHSLEKLEAVQALLNEKEADLNPSWNQEELQRRITKGDQELAEGKAISWDEAKAKMEAYFDEK